MSIEINQESLCEFCEENLDVDSNACEGRQCDDARKSYIVEYGLEEINPEIFGTACPGDTIFYVEDINIGKSKIISVERNQEETTLNIEGGISETCKNTAKAGGCIFLKKADAIAGLKEKLSEVTETIVMNLAEFISNND